MNGKKIAGILAGVAVIAFVVLKLKNNKEIAENRVFQFEKEKAISISAQAIQLENNDAAISFTGTFEPFKETKISAEVQGKINEIRVDVGTEVVKGQTLIQLDNSLLRLQLQAIEVQLEGLENDVKRYRILAQADAIQGIQLEKAELGLKSANVQKATLMEQIAKTTIKAPFSGIVTAKLSEEGAFAAPGMPLLQITDLSRLKFTIAIPESDLKKFRSKQTYAITIDVLPDDTLKGEVILIGSKANMGSSFPVQFLVKNSPDLKIKSGMFGKVLLKNEQHTKAIIIPSSAILGST
ncbi:MAG TPA: efflux RND transporter periplasmic adaptor subunit, partial [Bacteroidetes bacterium]|nr:efflux RND transporter periplasmic adaptor subunit [Bacteroidota bacterium]